MQESEWGYSIPNYIKAIEGNLAPSGKLDFGNVGEETILHTLPACQ